MKHSVPVKKEEDFGLQIKEENLRDGHSRDSRSEMDRERGIKENSEKKGGKEANRGDDSTGDSSKEVRKSPMPAWHFLKHWFYKGICVFSFF